MVSDSTRRCIFLFASWLAPLVFRAPARAAEILGQVVNSENGRGVAGVRVSVSGGGPSALSNLDGAFTLAGVEPGLRDLSAVKDGFTPVSLTGVSVAADRPTSVEIPLQPNAGVVTLAAFSVAAEVVRGSGLGLLSERQKALAVSDAISGDQFSRLAVGNAAEAMTKVTGASLVDGKYVLIRGLGDRYANTLLNGVAVPSADPDKRAVQMDQFPGHLIESIVTSKSFTPDQPGAFSGGSVNLRTKSFPEQFFFSAGSSVSVAYNSNSTRAELLVAPGFSGDLLARSAARRAAPVLPATIPDRTTARFAALQGNAGPAEQLDAASRAFDNRVYFPATRRAGPDYGLNLAFGDRLTWDEGRRVFGYTASISFDRSYDHQEGGEKNRYNGVANAVQPKLLLTPDRSLMAYAAAPSLPAFTPPLGVTESSRKSSWSAFTKLAFRPSLAHEVTLDLLRTQSGDDQVQRGVGEQSFDYPGNIDEVYSLLYTERSVSSAQLAGRSQFAGGRDVRVEWRLARSTSTQDQPDYRTLSVYYNPRGDFINATGVQPNRFFRELAERSTEAGADVSVPVDVAGREGRIKFGGVVTRGDRDYREQRFQWTSLPQNHAQLEAFPGSVGITGRSGNAVTFGNTIQRLQEPNNYTADQRIGGLYAMADLPAGANWRLVGGLRREETRLEAVPVRLVGVNPRDGRINQRDWLPALGVVFASTPKTNWRAAFGRTVARPTYKELSDIRYEDVFTLDTYVGNPDLRLTRIDNYDLRWESFPRRGEAVAVSAFLKRMTDPIEVVFRPQVGSTQPQNVERGRVFGVEFEFRRGLEAFSPALAAFTFGANLALIGSRVTIPAAEMASIRLQDAAARDERELLGQSPYTFNADLTWQGRTSGTSATVSFNVVGERLSLVQFGSIPDVYEQPAPSLNLVVAQRLWRGLRLRFAARNLLDPEHRRTIGLADRDLNYERHRSGRTFSLSVSYLFE